MAAGHTSSVKVRMCEQVVVFKLGYQTFARFMELIDIVVECITYCVVPYEFRETVCHS